MSNDIRQRFETGIAAAAGEIDIQHARMIGQRKVIAAIITNQLQDAIDAAARDAEIVDPAFLLKALDDIANGGGECDISYDEMVDRPTMLAAFKRKAQAIARRTIARAKG